MDNSRDKIQENERRAYSLSDIDQAAARLKQLMGSFSIFTFSGDMGAGKTTLISHLCALLQVQDHVSSPTFALVNEYHYEAEGNDRVIYHMDWYRLRDSADAISAGMEDYLLQAHHGLVHCFVEWPEKAPGLLRPPYLSVNITTAGPEEREMTLLAVE